MRTRTLQVNHHFNASTSQVTGIKMRSIGEERRRRERGTERRRRGKERRGESKGEREREGDWVREREGQREGRTE